VLDTSRKKSGKTSFRALAYLSPPTPRNPGRITESQAWQRFGRSRGVIAHLFLRCVRLEALGEFNRYAFACSWAWGGGKPIQGRRHSVRNDRRLSICDARKLPSSLSIPRIYWKEALGPPKRFTSRFFFAAATSSLCLTHSRLTGRTGRRQQSNRRDGLCGGAAPNSDDVASGNTP
jgi:hypothetical protein